MAGDFFLPGESGGIPTDTAGNPFMPGKLQTLGMMLSGLGSGISAASARNMPAYLGIAPGAQSFTNAYQGMLGRAMNYDLARKNYDLNASYKNMQERQLDLQTKALQNKLAMGQKLLGLVDGAGGDTSLPGFRTPQPLMGPSALPVANNIGNVRPTGASTGFQAPQDFNSGVALAVNNARAYPQAFNNGQPMSIAQIAQHWAPKGDGNNDPNAWAFNVARGSGLDPNQPLDLNNPQTAAQFARGVHLAEKGGAAVRPVADYLPGASGQPGAPSTAGMPQMPGPPPDTSGIQVLSSLAGFPGVGQAVAGRQTALQKYLMDRYNAQLEQRKEAFSEANGAVTFDANGNPVTNPAVPAAARAKGDAEKHYAEAAAPYKTQDFQNFLMSLPMVDRANIQSAIAEGKFDDVRKLVTTAQAGIPWEYRNLHGTDLMAKLPAGMQSLMSGVMDGSISAADLPSRAAQSGVDTSKVNVLALAKQIDPDFSTTTGFSRKLFEEDLAHGQGLVKLNALNAAPQHLSQYLDLMSALKNGNTPLVNKIVNEYRTQTGDPRATNADALAGILAAEVAKAVKGAGTLNEAEVDRNVEALSNAHSPDQAIGIAKTWANALNAQIKNLQERAKAYNIPEKTRDAYINPQAQAALARINSAGKPQQQAQSDLQRLSPEDAQKLPPGTQFIGLDGVQRVRH
jgi:hypothetical protein